MNKDFEKAYKELARVEAPDLWDRIENGLNEKSAPVKKKSSFVVFLKRYSALAAAVLCAVILIPAMIVMKRSGSKSFSEKAMSAEDFNTAVTEACETTEEAVSEESVEESVEELVEESVEEPVEEYAAATAADMEAGEGAQTGAAMAETETATDSRSEAADSGSDSLEDTAGGSDKENAVQAKEEGKLMADKEFTYVTVTIEETKEQMAEGDISEAGAICTGIVKNDPSGVLAEGEKIDIFIPVVSSVALFKGETYELDLSYREEKGVYTISAYHDRLSE